MPPTLNKLFPYLFRYRGQFAIGFVFLVLATTIQLLSPWVLKYAIDDLTVEVTRATLMFYAALLIGIALAGWHLPVLHAPHHHRRVARDRVRPAQRLLRPPAAVVPVLLSSAPDGRSDVSSHQRPERRADDGGAGRHVFSHDVDHPRRGSLPDALDFAIPHAARLDTAPVGISRSQGVRERDLSPVGADPGAAGSHERRGS